MWQGLFGVISLIGEVLVEIKASRRAKSKAVLADKLAKTRQPIAMEWIKDLPSQSEYQQADEVLPDVRKLYDGKDRGVLESPVSGKTQKVVSDES